MKNILTLIGIVCFLVGGSHEGQAQLRTKKIDRLINKQIAKYWKDQAIQQIPVDTKVNIEFDLFFDKNELYRLDNQAETVGFLLLRRGLGCKIGGCGNASDQGTGQICSSDGTAYEYFDYTVLLDTNLTILKIAVVDYPGDYGYEITSKGWLKQFVGYKGSKLTYGKNIDAISGATISANSLTVDIMAVHSMLEDFVLNKSLVALK